MTFSQYFTPAIDQQMISRKTALNILRAAISAHEFRFARETALAWLTIYPGDLLVGLLYAQALAGEKRYTQAIPVLEGLCEADPEFLQAAELLLQIEMETAARQLPDALAYVLALGGKIGEQETVATWGRQLWFSRVALKRGNFEQAEQLIRQALAANPPTPLVAVTHLQILEAQGHASLQAKRSLGEFYRQTWPNCLQCTLLLADWLMDSGEADKAVALLHEAAARDVDGQVARRLWGTEHNYQTIWPEQLEISLTVPVPAGVAAILGWNQLPAGESRTIDVKPEKYQEQQETNRQKMKKGADSVIASPVSTPEMEPETIPEEPLEKESLVEIQEELERLANRLNRPDLTQTDGRFPVYVLLSVRSRLEAIYGPQAAREIQAEMGYLVENIQAKPAVRNQRKWGARIFLADDPENIAELGIKPAKPGVPWDLKLAITDLDSALAKRGERIGALLIVGGPEVVPFHHLPNPVDDDDGDVPSDNPYATRDENYFIPEWPVGRLPGGAGNDPALLLNTLRMISDHYADEAQREPWYQRWWRQFINWLRPRLPGERLSFGYTAEVWRQASLLVFHPIGEPRSMLTSPPLSVMGANGLPSSFLPLPYSRLAYFNLHGLVDAAEWYGQKDPTDNQDGPDYPIALRPQDIGGSQNGGQTPQVVFSEACYGAHIQGKTPDEALALRFLDSGARAFIGSTAMAYGSISKPLIAADLLGNSFWNFLREGDSAGEALRKAKIQLASEMHQRQGYLDGEDQKTLISFILYGDPLAQPSGTSRNPKSFRRILQAPEEIMTICDRTSSEDCTQRVPDEVLTYVKHVVAQYLPGMEDAHLTFSEEQAECKSPHHLCPTSQLQAKHHVKNQPSRKLITLSKKVTRSKHVHNQYARLTLDANGKLVKLVVSR
jgi:tetratricopeptide (TPR) repeat protein